MKRNFAPLLVVGLVAGACGKGAEKGGCKSPLLAGDLVITEIMANPQGSDEGKEWFEIFNHTTSTLNLAGLQLVASRADGSGEEFHTVAEGQIAPGAYFVFGGMVPAVKPAYVDYTYGADLGGLRNSSGRLALRCGKSLVDEVVYLQAKEGIALQFDGARAPDAAANDQTDLWCDAKTEYETGSFGSPRAPNQPCGSIPPTSCKDGDSVREIVPPQAGDLVITEFMADPSKVADTAGEWFEVYVNRDLDLNGLKTGNSPDAWKDNITALECLRVRQGSYLVFARSADANTNGGLPKVDRLFTFTLANTSGSIALGYGDQLLDGISYSSSRAGASTSLEPTLSGADLNDNPAYWCAGSTPYGLGDLGSPGAANPSCGITPEGKCREGGQLRDLRAPQAGDLVITEIMADPAKVSDTAGEWFEVYVARDVDLNHLQVGRTAGTVDLTLPGGDCLAVASGTYIVFARSLDSGQNGGLPRADFAFSFGLTNSGGSLFVGYGGQVLDSVTYGTAQAGKSWSLDGGKLDPALNDEATNWCAGKDVYGLGDLGSPGAQNPACP
jgi:hypothetical protein